MTDGTSDQWEKEAIKSSFTCKRRRSIGNSAKDKIENNTSANTDTLVERRDANTTDADTAAFIDKTDESLS